jgi:hypothetical protein
MMQFRKSAQLAGLNLRDLRQQRAARAVGMPLSPIGERATCGLAEANVTDLRDFSTWGGGGVVETSPPSGP